MRRRGPTGRYINPGRRAGIGLLREKSGGLLTLSHSSHHVDCEPMFSLFLIALMCSGVVPQHPLCIVRLLSGSDQRKSIRINHFR
jgi:hypothetical protein